MNVVITGASGFIGSALGNALQNTDVVEGVVGLVRNPKDGLRFPTKLVGRLYESGECSGCFNNADVVIHLAGLAHVSTEFSNDPLTEFRRVNVAGTLNVAKAALAAGVRRFIFVSSIGVNGELNTAPFTESDQPNPTNAYSQSKWEAEQELLGIASSNSMEMVIIRPPLVYGPNAPGKFGSLVKWVGCGLPLPLGAVDNKRSLVALDNLVDLILTCIVHPNAPNHVFLAGDGEDISTTQLLRSVGQAMGKPSRLIPVPMGLLMFGARLLGKVGVAQNLLGSLQVDISKARNVLGWEPPLSVEDGLRRCFDSESVC